jgi:1-acyl-sn-glycerol-3-phosphate acyltransferase
MAVPWPVAYWLLKAMLSPFLYLFWRVKVEGREHLPSHGPAILAANHQSFCDSFFLPLVLRRRVTYVAKSEYFDSWKTAWFFRAAGQIPMNRGGGDKSQRALDTAIQILGEGNLLGIYPEGTRAPDVRLHKGHTGVARLALGCSVPVIPVGIIGTRRIQPPGCRIMRAFHPVTVRFGPPVSCPPSPVRGTDDGAAGPDPAALRDFTDALMTAIAQLSGQQYVDHYATRATGSGAAGGANGAPGTAAARALQARMGRSHPVTGRKQRIHNDGLA